MDRLAEVDSGLEAFGNPCSLLFRGPPGTAPPGTAPMMRSLGVTSWITQGALQGTFGGSEVAEPRRSLPTAAYSQQLQERQSGSASFSSLFDAQVFPSIFEANPRDDVDEQHVLSKRVVDSSGRKAEDCAQLLFECSCLSSGLEWDRPAELAGRIHGVLKHVLGTDVGDDGADAPLPPRDDTEALMAVKPLINIITNALRGKVDKVTATFLLSDLPCWLSAETDTEAQSSTTSVTSYTLTLNCQHSTIIALQARSANVPERTDVTINECIGVLFDFSMLVSGVALTFPQHVVGRIERIVKLCLDGDTKDAFRVSNHLRSAELAGSPARQRGSATLPSLLEASVFYQTAETANPQMKADEEDVLLQHLKEDDTKDQAWLDAADFGADLGADFGAEFGADVVVDVVVSGAVDAETTSPRAAAENIIALDVLD